LRLPLAGRLAPGCPADLVVFPALPGDPLEAVLAAGRAAVRLVIIGGRALYGDPDLTRVFALTGERAEPVRVDGREKLLAGWIVDRLRRSSIRETGLDLEGDAGGNGRAA
jgi:cytosine/adenosine deaminase-related metal-dependent hydrolase